MASFMQTMFVPTNSILQSCTASPKPLPALHSHVLASSETCSSPCTSPASPSSPRQSPLGRRIQQMLDGRHESPSLKDLHQQEPIERQEHGPQAGEQERKAFTRRQPRFIPRETMDQADRLNRSNSNVRNRNQTSFQPQKRAKGTSSWQLKQFAEATLGSGSLRKVVQLPEGEDRDEWLAVNVVDFYNQINLLYGAVTEFCSPTTCPEMKATDEFEYLWHDPPAFPKPTRLPAPTYISHLLNWTSNHLSDPDVFPTQPGVPFPPSFQGVIRTIFKRLYRIYAHIYCHHYAVVRGLGLEAHLNTGFKHYVLFVEEFGLADEKGAKKGEWFGPLGELVESMLRSD